MGLSVEQFETDSIKFQAYDMSGEVSTARERGNNRQDMFACASTLPLGRNIVIYALKGNGVVYFGVAGRAQSRSRALWDKQYADADAIIFVLDSADRMRLAVAKDELDHMLEQEAVDGRPIPLLLFANKMDLAGAMEPVECMAGLGLQGIADKPWHIQSSNARSGAGIEEGIRWLTAQCERYLKAKAAGFPARAAPTSAAGAGGAAAAAAAGRTGTAAASASSAAPG